MLTVIGDVHGYIDKLCHVMQAAELLDANRHWSAETATLWFLGDYVDRGPDGIAVIDLIMRLQREAAGDGGFVGALLGNHDVHMLAAREFGDVPDGSREGTFRASWIANGGDDHDMDRLETNHIEWLKGLPSMTVTDDQLLAHADATFYGNYGKTIDDVNAAIGGVMQSKTPGDWDALLDYFSQRRAFVDRFLGRERAARFLNTFGGQRFVHAHTPITKLSGKPPEDIREAYIYAGGLCIDVDPGLYMGGPGFVTRLDGA